MQDLNKCSQKKEIVCNTVFSARYDFLDVAKGIGIIFVIIAHVNYTPSLLTVIYSFHMPLFFFLSGMVFNSRKYEKFSLFFKRKIQTLICPYVLFYIFSILYHISIQVVADFENVNWDTYLSYFLQMFLSQGSEKLPNAPLWFVPCLFVVEIIYYFISRFNNFTTIVISIILTVLGWMIESDFFSFDNTLLPWSFDSALFAIGFFAIGNLIFGYICKTIVSLKENPLKAVKCLIIISFTTAVMIPMALFNGKISLGSKILNNGFVLYLTGVLGICGVLALSVLLEKNTFFKYCGRNSFQIMAVHYLIRDTVRLVYKFFDIPFYDKTSLMETIFPIIIVMSLSILFAMIYNKVKYLLKNITIRLNKIN